MATVAKVESTVRAIDHMMCVRVWVMYMYMCAVAWQVLSDQWSAGVQIWQTFSQGKEEQGVWICSELVCICYNINFFMFIVLQYIHLYMQL